MTDPTKNTKDLKFYSQKAIGLATFLGGPMAAGYLIRENYLNLEEEENGKKALIIGILSTIFLFVGIFSIPESFIENFPSQLLPGIYTVIIYFIVDKIHGKILKQHKIEGNEFHSKWKAAGIGIVSMFIIIAGLLGAAFLSYDDKLYEKYEEDMNLFDQNETETFKFFDEKEGKSKNTLILEIDSLIIPKWEENKRIIERINAYANFDQNIIDYNAHLTEYCDLRIESFEVIKREIQDETEYTTELDAIYLKIRKKLKDVR